MIEIEKMKTTEEIEIPPSRCQKVYQKCQPYFMIYRLILVAVFGLIFVFILFGLVPILLMGNTIRCADGSNPLFLAQFTSYYQIINTNNQILKTITIQIDNFSISELDFKYVRRGANFSLNIVKNNTQLGYIGIDRNEYLIFFNSKYLTSLKNEEPINIYEGLTQEAQFIHQSITSAKQTYALCFKSNLQQSLMNVLIAFLISYQENNQ